MTVPRGVALLAVAALFGCGGGGDGGSGPTGSNVSTGYSGSWTGVQAATSELAGTGVTFVVSGQSVSTLSVSTENFFGIGVGGPPPGCILAFVSTGPATITGNSFQVTLQLTSTPVPGVSSLAVAVGASFSGTVTLSGTFSSSTRASGQLSYNVTSAACGGRTFTGIGPGFGANTRAWTASR